MSFLILSMSLTVTSSSLLLNHSDSRTQLILLYLIILEILILLYIIILEIYINSQFYVFDWRYPSNNGHRDIGQLSLKYSGYKWQARTLLIPY